MVFSDLELSKRLERAEGYACAKFAEARRRVFPESGAEWMECAGTYAVFDGTDSPVTQTFGLGIFEELSAVALDAIEKFFFLDHGAPVLHEVSPFAGIATLDLSCRRNYRPIEVSNVLFREIEQPAVTPQNHISTIPKSRTSSFSQKLALTLTDTRSLSRRTAASATFPSTETHGWECLARTEAPFTSWTCAKGGRLP
jgi:hypothetical protein